MKHGEELICSYCACRNAGIKFRYCSHCKVPVAKRNFRKRHKHGGEIVARDDDDESAHDVCIPVKSGIPSQITAGRDESYDADGISSQSADSAELHLSKPEAKTEPQPVVQDPVQPIDPRKPDTLVAKKPTVEVDPTVMKVSDDQTISDERKEKWLSLLFTRPSNVGEEVMTAWFNEVLAVSDLEIPVNTTENSDMNEKASHEEKRRNQQAKAIECDNSTTEKQKARKVENRAKNGQILHRQQ